MSKFRQTSAVLILNHLDQFLQVLAIAGQQLVDKMLDQRGVAVSEFHQWRKIKQYSLIKVQRRQRHTDRLGISVLPNHSVNAGDAFRE
ncbi:hypothetical protein D3C72_1688700 [compost metagenome]